MKKKCIPGFVRKGKKCVPKKSGIFRVSWEVPTNFGFEKNQIKTFTSRPLAEKEFRKRLTELKRDVKRDDFEGGEGVILEDLNTDIRLRSRIVDEDGKIQNNDLMI